MNSNSILFLNFESRTHNIVRVLAATKSPVWIDRCRKEIELINSCQTPNQNTSQHTSHVTAKRSRSREREREKTFQSITSWNDYSLSSCPDSWHTANLQACHFLQNLQWKVTPNFEIFPSKIQKKLSHNSIISFYLNRFVWTSSGKQYLRQKWNKMSFSTPNTLQSFCIIIIFNSAAQQYRLMIELFIRYLKKKTEMIRVKKMWLISGLCFALEDYQLITNSIKHLVSDSDAAKEKKKASQIHSASVSANHYWS